VAQPNNYLAGNIKTVTSVAIGFPASPAPSPESARRLTPGQRETTLQIPQVPLPNKPPDLKPSERWVVIASRSELEDAISIAQDYRQNYPGTLVVQSQNGQFAVIIGPIDVQQNPSFLRHLTDSNKIPRDAYYSAGNRFVAVVWAAR
jgi:hypothetical protein